MKTPNFTGSSHRREWGADAAEHTYTCDRCGEPMSQSTYSLKQLNRGVCTACEVSMNNANDLLLHVICAADEVMNEPDPTEAEAFAAVRANDLFKTLRANVSDTRPIVTKALELMGVQMYMRGRQIQAEQRAGFRQPESQS